MKNHQVFTKTGKGSRMLPICRQLLSPPQCKVLSLINGKFTLEDIQARISSLDSREFQQIIAFLGQEGYIRTLPNKVDELAGPASMLGVEELDTEHGVKEWAAAMRVAETLQLSGYFLSQDDKAEYDGPQQILVIDDEPSIGKAVSIVLGAVGFAVESIEDPLLALDKIKSMPGLALVLLDVVMPQENGFTILRQIRAQPQLHSLPVVMLTAHANPEYVAEGLREGADGYILKPFKPEKLISYLQDTLKIKKPSHGMQAKPST